MTETLTLVLTALTLGQITLVLSILIAKHLAQPRYQPFIWFFIALCCLLMQPLMKAFLPEAELFSILIMLPALLMLAPLLWMYVLNMTATRKIELSASTFIHFLLPLAGLIVSTLTALLPTGTLTELFTNENAELSAYVGALMICAFLLVLSWLAQSAFYVVRIVKRVSRYHRSLNDHFANNESRKMTWMLVVSGLLVAIWLLALVAVFADNVFNLKIMNSAGATFMALIWVWGLSYFAITQSPGFEDESDDGTLPDVQDQSNSKKYQRSALSHAHAERIAEKLENLMKSESVYLDPNISLSKLANMTGISANYVSQTLNQTMQRSFFDYINGWRIQHAKSMLIESNKSILDIAYEVGFNARSSFYKAFKQCTDQTPSEYRRQVKRD